MQCDVGNNGKINLTKKLRFWLNCKLVVLQHTKLILNFIYDFCHTGTCTVENVSMLNFYT